ncbi:MAG: hypothetical protein CHACPFDD_01953 [Phycisphaerae bacterium]|nr:hypothetical protein [Phycisphaerae bacterium]
MQGKQNPDDSVDAPADDAALVGWLRASEPAACEAFVRREVGRALAVARRLLGSEADAADAVQDAFASFFTSLDRFRRDARLSTWLHRIVVNAALARRRAAARRHERTIDELLPTYEPDGHRQGVRPAWDASGAASLEREETRAIVRRRIDELPADYRDVIMLRDVEEMGTAETAAALGVTPGAVKVRLHRARQALRSLLEEEFAP